MKRTHYFLIGLGLAILVLAGCGAAVKLPAQNAWQDYENKEFGFSMKYPKGWEFEAQNVTAPAESMLDIHLSNMAPEDSLSCPKNFIGLELQAGLRLNEGEKSNFKTFVKNFLNRSTDELGAPSGEIKELKINGHTAFQSEKSGWDSPCKGRGYIIEQDQKYYSYVFTGSDEMNQKNTEPGVIMEILSSVEF